MITLISPAKTLDYKEPAPTSEFTQPQMLDESQRLVDVMQKKRPVSIKKLMSVNDQIAQLNYDRYQEWTQPFDTSNSKQAIFAFQGDVYRGLKAANFDEGDLEFAQNHLRILSGLYGLLRPLDLMRAYRLEMGTRLKTPRGKNLYEFWKNRITDLLNQELEGHKEKVVVNLASNEYWNAVNVDKLNADVITPEFKDLKNGEYKFIQTYGKLARGFMSRWIIQNRVDSADQLPAFDGEAYYFAPEQSEESRPVYHRDGNDLGHTPSK